MEGPIRVMKQLEAVSKILEVTDADLLKHLVLAGADNFLFAFRMLLVLFRRELSFAEALYMWEVWTLHLFYQTPTFQFSAHGFSNCIYFMNSEIVVNMFGPQVNGTWRFNHVLPIFFFPQVLKS